MSSDTAIPIKTLAVEVNASGTVMDVRVDIGEGQGGPFNYDLVLGPAYGISGQIPMTLLSPAMKVHPAVRLENDRYVPGLDVHPGNTMARENVV